MTTAQLAVRLLYGSLCFRLHATEDGAHIYWVRYLGPLPGEHWMEREAASEGPRLYSEVWPSKFGTSLRLHPDKLRRAV